MSKNFQVNLMKKIKKDYKRTLVKDINIFLKKKKKKSNIMVVNITKISDKMKKNKLDEYRKKYYKTRKSALL